MHDEADDLMARVIVEAKPFENAQGAAMALAHIGQTKYVPKPLVATLTNMANSGDPAQMQKALDFYRAMTTLRNPAGDSVGEALRASMPDEARSFFDNLSQNVSLGFTPDDLAAKITIHDYLDARDALLKALSV